MNRGASRRAGLAAVAALAVVAVAPAQFSSADSSQFNSWWDGAWNTQHEGVHTMNLQLEQKNNSREVTGTFTHKLHDGSKGSSGKIYNAEAKGDKGQRLEGYYKDTKGGSSKGYFEIKLEKNDTGAFEGQFGKCKWWKPWCDDPTYAWTGTKH